ncbi:hypothetical protein PJM27_29085, partial [Mycobacterium kansasii]
MSQQTDEATGQQIAELATKGDRVGKVPNANDQLLWLSTECRDTACKCCNGVLTIRIHRCNSGNG